MKLTPSECDFRTVTELTALKVCIPYEFIRELAIEGSNPACAWLDREYPSWDRRPFKDVPPALRKERMEKLEYEEGLASASQISLSPNDLPAREIYAEAVEGRSLAALPTSITNAALAKVDGLTRGKYEQFMAQRGRILAKRGTDMAMAGTAINLRDGRPEKTVDDNDRFSPITKEAAFLEIDWSLPDQTIITCLRAFLKLHRPIEPIEQERGLSCTVTGLRQILEALVVYRLLGRAGLSIPQAAARMERWGLRPPYSLNRESRWNEAKELANVLLAELKNGRFVEATQRFLMTRQARKLFRPSGSVR